MYTLKDPADYARGLEVRISEEQHSHMSDWKKFFYKPIITKDMRDKDKPICSHCGFSDYFCECETPNFVDAEEFYELQRLSKPVSEEEMVKAFPGYPPEAYREAVQMGLPHPLNKTGS